MVGGRTVALRVGVAFVWLATGVLVLHPAYRAIGAEWLGRVNAPTWLMPLTCVFEVALAARVALGPMSSWLAALQIGMIATFTVILAVADPMLLVSPFGMLTKNIPIVACVAAAWLVEREGWTARALWTLRAGVAAIWLTEGLFPKMLFQQPVELAIAARCFPFASPSLVLHCIGAAQIAGGLLALALPMRGRAGRLLGALLAAQAASLVVLALVMTWLDPLSWVHPFGPLTKNMPIFVGTLVARRRLRSLQAPALEVECSRSS
jgi:hypothetical protein